MQESDLTLSCRERKAVCGPNVLHSKHNRRKREALSLLYHCDINFSNDKTPKASKFPQVSLNFLSLNYTKNFIYSNKLHMHRTIPWDGGKWHNHPCPFGRILLCKFGRTIAATEISTGKSPSPLPLMSCAKEFVELFS